MNHITHNNKRLIQSVQMYLCAATLTFLPYVILGEGSVVTIHDFLDSVISYMKMYYENDLFWVFNGATPALSNMSTLYIPFSNFSLQSGIYATLPPFEGFLFSIILASAVSFFSFRILLSQIFPSNADEKFFDIIALAFAFLPNYYGWSLSIASAPLCIALFLKLRQQPANAICGLAFLAFLFPFCSTFVAVGIFLLGFWFLGTCFISYKNKQLHRSLTIAFVLMVIGFVLSDLRLFYSVLYVKEPLNRSVFEPTAITGVWDQIFLIGKTVKRYLLKMHYHARSLHRPVILLSVLFCVIALFKQRSIFIRRLSLCARNEKVFIATTGFLLFSILVIGLSEAGIMTQILSVVLPPLQGLNISRIFLLSRIAWYVAFAGALLLLPAIITSFLNKRSLRHKVFLEKNVKRIAMLLACLQLCIVLFYGASKQYSYFSTSNYVKLFHIVAGLSYEKTDDNISYDEFFATNLFEQIKQDIEYADEKVVAFGFHPSVLMYNGFHTIDGYNPAYPLRYMKKFRTLISPELQRNPSARSYYDNWGGRMYLFNKDVPYSPTRTHFTGQVDLYINPKVFRDDLNGKYVLSRAIISNAAELGLQHLKSYSEVSSIYIIHLYLAAAPALVS